MAKLSASPDGPPCSTWRAAIIRLAKSRAEVADQLERLIAWHDGEGCV